MVLFACGLCIVLLYFCGKGLAAPSNSGIHAFLEILLTLAIMLVFAFYITSIFPGTVLNVMGLCCLIFFPIMSGAGMF